MVEKDTIARERDRKRALQVSSDRLRDMARQEAAGGQSGAWFWVASELARLAAEVAELRQAIASGGDHAGQA